MYISIKFVQQKLLLFLVTLLLANTIQADDNYDKLRRHMINTINQIAWETQIETGKATLDKKIMEVMAKVPRHEFVPEKQRPYAYDNRPLPVGYGQTISQPYIVALMTDILEVDSNDVVLEIGTGSGYQAAILAELVKHVYTIEIIKELGKSAQDTLAKLNYDNVKVKIGDGYYGWAEYAPFDGIIVTAAPSEIPPLLINQLKPGGRMIIPVGEYLWVQSLTLIEKDEQGETTSRKILPVAFVPFTGEH